MNRELKTLKARLESPSDKDLEYQIRVDGILDFVRLQRESLQAAKHVFECTHVVADHHRRARLNG
jgi:hypothetical protein